MWGGGGGGIYDYIFLYVYIYECAHIHILIFAVICVGTPVCMRVGLKLSQRCIFVWVGRIHHLVSPKVCFVFHPREWLTIR